MGCTDVSLPFVYCKQCAKHLDENDASMNLDLLKILSSDDV